MLKKSFPWFLFQAVFYGGLLAFPKNLRRYSRWKTYLRYSGIEERLPWLTFSAVDWLEANLRPGFRVFEWGSGGSTLYFFDRCQEVVSVETNLFWWDRVLKSMMDHLGKVLGGIDLQFVRANQVVGYGDYFKVFEDDLEKGFDLVLVDGLARPECIRLAGAKLSPGAFLVVDDAQRREYREAIASVLSGFEVVCSEYGPALFHPDFKVTLILRKRL